jgi:hypothetical protein
MVIELGGCDSCFAATSQSPSAHREFCLSIAAIDWFTPAKIAVLPIAHRGQVTFHGSPRLRRFPAAEKRGRSSLTEVFSEFRRELYHIFHPGLQAGYPTQQIHNLLGACTSCLA